ncbi:MAG: hypothetical protein ACJASF_001653 [Vicingaceae bacterium]|jgi:hypothetical protein
MNTKSTLIEKMKNELSLWICDANFWIDEVEDCQSILEHKISLIDEVPEKKRLDQLQNQIIYYRDELLPLFKHDLVEQNEKMDQTSDTSVLTASHKALEKRGNAITEQMKERRRQLDLFVNNI